MGLNVRGLDGGASACQFASVSNSIGLGGMRAFLNTTNVLKKRDEANSWELAPLPRR